MKKPLFLFIAITISITTLSAQNTNTEIGLRLSNFQSFGAIYKKEMRNGDYFRLRGATGIFQLGLVNDNSSFQFRSDLAIGVEIRKKISDKLVFYRGFEPFLNLAYRSSTGPTANVGVGIGYVLGLSYDINQQFYVSIETIPSLGLSIQASEFEALDNVYVEGGINASNVALSIIHRFELKKK
ncbi:hypothetical protein [Portibacter lacus]|uniref:Outer membrane protein beta-barrel domain-containing protein n=1 Tax=Portibacter lacus TaxID=1099794 RepID=A0AA37SL63_9BACT|nr:hypothetical protein [Portibacter lacus]GLR15619.1 hypothetical protein GCM10007940_02340 [Portibacter lacus]